MESSSSSSFSSSSSSVAPLNVDFIRHLALFFNYREIFHNSTSRIISFDHHTNDVRINIYYTTGTVGTVLKHPSHPHRTQLFRFKCSIEDINGIFQNPRMHTGRGYYTKNDASYQREYCAKNESVVWQSESYLEEDLDVRSVRPLEEEAELKIHRQRIDEIIQQLQIERSNVTERLIEFEEKRREEQRKREEEQRKAEEKRKEEEQLRMKKEESLSVFERRKEERGDRIARRCQNANQVLELFDDDVSCIAMNGSLTVFLDDSGARYGRTLKLENFQKR